MVDLFGIWYGPVDRRELGLVGFFRWGGLKMVNIRDGFGRRMRMVGLKVVKDGFDGMVRLGGFGGVDGA